MLKSAFRSWLISLRAALVLMTTLPVSYPEIVTEVEQRRSMYCYPAVGAMLGVMLWLIASFFEGGTLLSASVLLLVWIVLTGALHLDGLADCADAWMAGLGDRDKTLRVLKDPLCGAISLVTLIVVLLVKVAALQQLMETGALVSIIVIPLLARVSPQIMFWYLPYLREGGLGTSLKTSQEDCSLLWYVLAGTAIFALLFMGADAIWLMLVTALVGIGVARASLSRLGGFTGDVVGAQIELIECALCVTAALVI